MKDYDTTDSLKTAKMLEELAREKGLAPRPKFYNWEYRPAMIDGDRGWVVAAPGEPWEPADPHEIIDSGDFIGKDEDKFRARFSETFPDIPVLPLAQRLRLN